MPNCAIFYAFLCSWHKKRGCGVWKRRRRIWKKAQKIKFSAVCVRIFTPRETEIRSVKKYSRSWSLEEDVVEKSVKIFIIEIYCFFRVSKWL
jgi:hypothetical protein